ncbi:hypothetical protein GcM1_146004 [Golovinomyces cichoracearum]|uniref:Uncharacterized protein n=1 Tax=Golovinomyces cichoracearum TaxID=62708 RepID=A0A420JB62_9PEZI|nr:hypothetical protein GcM1_146004 [Golovinomyces cichoracearum]
MSLMSYNSSEDGAQTPETVTESLKSIHLNNRETVENAGEKIQKVNPVLALPSMFVWCLRCAVLIRIDYPAGHKIEQGILPCKPGESLFFSTVCSNCLELQYAGTENRYNSLASRSQLIDRNEEAVYISPQCVEQCRAFEKARSLTQILCEYLIESIYGSSMLYHASIKKIYNLCDAKCRLRTVVTDQRRTEDYENFMVAGFM